MSLKCLTWVFLDSDANGFDRLVLLALADEADDDGTNAYPSIKRLALKARVGESTVRRSLGRMEEAGQIVVQRPAQRGRGHVWHYAVVMETRRSGGFIDETGEETEPEKARRNAPERAGPLAKPTRTRDPIDKTSRSSVSSRRATACADPFLVDEPMQIWANENAPDIDWRAETEQFVDHHRAKGSTFKDWRAAWRTWMRNAAKWNARPSPGRLQKFPTPTERTMQNLGMTGGGENGDGRGRGADDRGAQRGLPRGGR